MAVDFTGRKRYFGKWFGVVLSAENKKQFLFRKILPMVLCCRIMRSLLINVRIFTTLTMKGNLYNDPEIGVEWPVPEGMELIMSEKDQKWGRYQGIYGG